jgi:hypothetical protein
MSSLEADVSLFKASGLFRYLPEARLRAAPPRSCWSLLRIRSLPEVALAPGVDIIRKRREKQEPERSGHWRIKQSPGMP